METKVFIANVSALEDEELFGRLYEAMDGERKTKIDSCLFGKDKRLSLGVGTLLKMAQQEYGPGICYNLSHSGQLAMCIISDRQVGCDVEKHREKMTDIAGRFFYKSEYEKIMSQPDEESRRNMFFRFWTLKESFMKVTKLGFELPLNGFEILMKGDKISVSQSVDGAKYSFFEYDFSPDYGCAVSIRDYDGEKPELKEIDLRELRF